MTCIVGVARDGKTWIGGDSAGSDGWMVAVRSRQNAKVFKLKIRDVEMVFGYTTSFRMGDLLRYSLDLHDNPPPHEPEALDRWMRITFVRALRQCFKDGGYLCVEDGVERGGTFIVGVHGRLFGIEDDFQVGELASGYAAVGSGYLSALGALHALTVGQKKIDAMAVVLSALKAAEAHTTTVRGPFNVEVA